jgi:hypothetical protein
MNWWQFVQPFIPQPQQPSYRPPQPSYRPRPQPYPVYRPTFPTYVPAQPLKPPANVLTSPLVQPLTTQPPANVLALKKTPPKNNLTLLLPKPTQPLDDGLRAKLKLEKKEGERSAYAYQSPASQEQEKLLNDWLGILETALLKEVSKVPGLDMALQDAKTGNLGPLKKLLDDYKKQHPNPTPDQKFVINTCEAYIATSELAEQAKAGKPLDEKKLDAFAQSLNKVTPQGGGDQAKAALWALNKLVPPVPPAGPGPGGPGQAGPGPGIGPGQPVYPPGYVPGVIYGPPVVDLTVPMPRGDIVLMNRLENGAVVRYAISNRQYELAAGRTHASGLPGQGSWTIVFDRGGSYGTARYSLSVGAYEFVLTATGWDLHKKQYIVTIDNSQLAGAFKCLLDGKETTVTAGESVTLTSPYPMEIVFDRGDGSEPARKLLDNGVYKVGLDATGQRLDLFPASSASITPSLP